jgi:hypothetical protein
MKKVLIVVCLAVFNIANAQTNRPIGVNLAGVNDYASQFIFTNSFKQGRPWISSNADNTGSWNTQISIPLRHDGYPLEIPFNNGLDPDQIIKTLLVWDLDLMTPAGNYRLTASGTGQIRLRGGASGTYNSPIDTLVSVSSGVIMEIQRSDISDPIHDIHFVLPDYINTYQNQVFTTEILNFLSDFQVIRFMNFTATNGSPNIDWSSRTTEDFYTQAREEGGAWEYVTQLANSTQKDIWINIPHLANDNYLDSLAHFIHNHLDTSLKVYLEYSNETWNAIFSQNSQSAQLGQNLGYTGQAWERTWKYTAKRSADIFKAFEDVFPNSNRLVKVIPSMAANSWLSNQLVTYFNDLNYNPNQVTADAIAIAPYFGYSVANNIADNGLINSITIPEIIDSLRNAQARSEVWILENLLVANNHNLSLIAYEGGQHLVANGSSANNDTLTQKLIAANRDTAMQSLYCKYFNFWYDTVGTAFCHYSAVRRPGRFGSWGIIESFEDTLNPKYLGLQSCVFYYNTPAIGIIEDKLSEEISLYPNPTSGIVNISSSNDQTFRYKLYGSIGQLLLEGQGKMVNLGNFPAGVYHLKVNETTHKILKYE